MKNKILGRNTKKIVIVSNSAKEKTDFFKEQLKYNFDVEVMNTVHINELYLLKNIDFDTLITFSNRISKNLKNFDFPIIKTPYFLHNKDIEYLHYLNFSSNYHRKILAKNFADDILKVKNNELIDFLKEKYPNFFI